MNSCLVKGISVLRHKGESPFLSALPLGVFKRCCKHLLREFQENPWITLGLVMSDNLNPCDQNDFRGAPRAYGRGTLHTLRRAQPSEALSSFSKATEDTLLAIIHGFTPVAFREGG